MNNNKAVSSFSSRIILLAARKSSSARRVASSVVLRPLTITPCLQSTFLPAAAALSLPQSYYLFSTTAASYSFENLRQQEKASCCCRHSFFSSSSAAPSSHDNNDEKNKNEIPFVLADIGEGIKEVELLQWFVQPGDTVSQFDKICEVQSDKATVEITSRFDGVVTHLNGQAGDMLQVGEPLLFLQSSSPSSSKNAPTQQQQAPSETNRQDNPETSATTSLDSTATSSNSGKLVDDTNRDSATERLQIPTVASQFHLHAADDDDGDSAATQVLTSPAVRKLAREYSLDVSTVRGSGPAGRVLKSDVVTYLQEQGRWKKEEEEPKQAAAAEGTKPTKDTVTTTSRQQQTLPQEQQDEIVALKGYSRLMVKSMTAALQTPHMSFGDEVVCNHLLQARQQLNNNNADSESSVKISVLALLIKALDLALTAYPQVNAVVHNVERCEICIRRDHNIGIAMDTPRGLVVPVLRNVQTLSIAQIQAQLNALKNNAKDDGKFAESQLQDATFTISNIGSVGSGTYMQPVLAPPALAMGALGRIRTLPRFRDDKSDIDLNSVYAAQVLTVTWAADHRFLDGATLGRFHNAFARYVEQPVQMLAQLK